MKSLQLAFVLGLFFVCAGVSRAATVLGTEDNVNGFIGTISPSFVHVASDGESEFHPFNITTVDVTDAINFDDQVNAGFPWDQVAGGAWLQSPGTHTWYLPEAIPQDLGAVEPIGEWHSSFTWITSIIGTYQILDASGAVSDEINLFNDANGAVLTFNSNPGAAVPTPSTIMGGMVLLGVVGGGRLIRRKA